MRECVVVRHTVHKHALNACLVICRSVGWVGGRTYVRLSILIRFGRQPSLHVWPSKRCVRSARGRRLRLDLTSKIWQGEGDEHEHKLHVLARYYNEDMTEPNAPYAFLPVECDLPGCTVSTNLKLCKCLFSLGLLRRRGSDQQFICCYNFNSLKTTVFTPRFHFSTN